MTLADLMLWVIGGALFALGFVAGYLFHIVETES